MSRSTLRKRILTSVAAFILLSLFGSTLTLFRITSVSRSLDSINQILVPLNQVAAQIRMDGEILKKEMSSRLGFRYWKDPNWNPKPIPVWIRDVVESEISRMESLLARDWTWISGDSTEKNEKGQTKKGQWNIWVREASSGLAILRKTANQLYLELRQEEYEKASRTYLSWTSSLEAWVDLLEVGEKESEQSLRVHFKNAEEKVRDAKIGLQVILGVVVCLSLLLFWLGERALRPLEELTELVRKITQRGLRKEDKAHLPELSLNRSDEVSQLAREFHRMATTLLEREKTVESQKTRLAEQNQLLQKMGSLNENILQSIQSVIIVADLEGKITQLNSPAVTWLQGVSTKNLDEEVLGRSIFDFEKMQLLFKNIDVRHVDTSVRLSLVELENKVYSPRLMPLKPVENQREKHQGVIFIVEDMTEQVELEKRLQFAENLAAAGRMSAQVAHEVRNPLHSIGLEAEVALEALSQEQGEFTSSTAKQSVQAILNSVDRLEKITENYLSLSRLSSGKKSKVWMDQVLERVLATYSLECEKRKVKVNWRIESAASLCVYGDPDALEQALGNLFRNSLQCFEELEPNSHFIPRIDLALGNTEDGKVWLEIRDNGPGIQPDFEQKLYVPFQTTKAQGTGLGLSFVKRVVEDHQGDIRYHTKNGAVFQMILPSLEVDEKTGFADFKEERPL